MIQYIKSCHWFPKFNGDQYVFRYSACMIDYITQANKKENKRYHF